MYRFCVGSRVIQEVTLSVSWVISHRHRQPLVMDSLPLGCLLCMVSMSISRVSLVVCCEFSALISLVHGGLLAPLTKCGVYSQGNNTKGSDGKVGLLWK